MLIILPLFWSNVMKIVFFGSFNQLLRTYNRPIFNLYINFGVTRCRGIRHINVDLYFKDFTDTADRIQHITPNNNQQRTGQNQEYKYTHSK